MYCPSCREIIDNDCKYCTKCGQMVVKKESDNSKIGRIIFRLNIQYVYFPNDAPSAIWYNNKLIASINCNKLVYCDIPYGKYRFNINYGQLETYQNYIDIIVDNENSDLIVDIIIIPKKYRSHHYQLWFFFNNLIGFNRNRYEVTYVSVEKNANDWNELIQIKEVEKVKIENFLD